MKQPDKKQRFNGMAEIGMGLGLLFGILWENLPLGLLMGAALACFGNMTTKRQADGYEKMDTYFQRNRIAFVFTDLCSMQPGK